MMFQPHVLVNVTEGSSSNILHWFLQESGVDLSNADSFVILFFGSSIRKSTGRVGFWVCFLDLWLEQHMAISCLRCHINFLSNGIYTRYWILMDMK
jgi:hypothetical protein